MKKLRTISLVFVILVSIIALSGCTEETGVTKIGIIFATGKLGDKSFNDAGYRGYLQANESFGEDFTLDYVEPDDIPDFATFQNTMATEGTYDLIICVGFLQATSLNESARDFPDQDWVIIDDDTIDLPNVQPITFKEHESGFLVGAMAAMTTQTDKLGYIGGMDIYLINKFYEGYRQGAEYIDASINVTKTYMTVPPPGCWNDPIIAKGIAESLYAAGNDIIFVAAGGSGQGVFSAANETTGAYAIGVDSDQDGDMPGKVLCSMLKKVETAVYTSIKAAIDGTWTSDALELGLAEEGVGISPMTHTLTIKNGDFTIGTKTQSRWDWVMEFKEAIVNGTIVVTEPTS